MLMNVPVLKKRNWPRMQQVSDHKVFGLYVVHVATNIAVATPFFMSNSANLPGRINWELEATDSR